MKRVEPCVVCGKMTTSLLFKDKLLDTHVCSKKCEDEYLNRVPSEVKEQLDEVRSLDNKIEESRRCNRISWGTSGLGLLLIASAFVIINAAFFIGGALIAAIGAFSTRYYENKMYHLTKLRKSIAL
jgi:hypothetical protein